MTHRTDLEARHHRHHDQPKPHLHRRGHEPHDHAPDGRPQFFADDAPTAQLPARDPATGKFVAKAAPAEADTIILDRPDLTTCDGMLTDFDEALDALGDPAEGITLAYENAGFYIDLDMRQFDYEVAQFREAATRLQQEVVERSRFMVLAAAAQQQGHHPLMAYCFVADRLDPAGAA